MTTNFKILTLALGIAAAVQTSYADHLQIGIGTAPTVQNPRPASPDAGSPPIYYSNQPYVQPSITPPSMNLLPSFGYSTGFYVQPTNYRPPTTAANTLGTRTFAPQGVGVVTPGLSQATPVVNQRRMTQRAQPYNFTTNPAPQPRLTRGVLNN